MADRDDERALVRSGRNAERRIKNEGGRPARLGEDRRGKYPAPDRLYRARTGATGARRSGPTPRNHFCPTCGTGSTGLQRRSGGGVPGRCSELQPGTPERRREPQRWRARWTSSGARSSGRCGVLPVREPTGGEAVRGACPQPSAGSVKAWKQTRDLAAQGPPRGRGLGIRLLPAGPPPHI